VDSSDRRVRWSGDLGLRWAGVSLVLAAASVVAWVVFAAKVRAAGGLGGITEGPWSPGLAVGLSLGAAVLTGLFSAAAMVVSSVAVMLGRTIDHLERDPSGR
jgi:hypothetical protein